MASKECAVGHFLDGTVQCANGQLIINTNGITINAAQDCCTRGASEKLFKQLWGTIKCTIASLGCTTSGSAHAMSKQAFSQSLLWGTRLQCYSCWTVRKYVHVQLHTLYWKGRMVLAREGALVMFIVNRRVPFLKSMLRIVFSEHSSPFSTFPQSIASSV